MKRRLRRRFRLPDGNRVQGDRSQWPPQGWLDESVYDWSYLDDLYGHVQDWLGGRKKKFKPIHDLSIPYLVDGTPSFTVMSDILWEAIPEDWDNFEDDTVRF